MNAAPKTKRPRGVNPDCLILSPKEVCGKLNISSRMIYDDLESGLCPGFKVGSHWKIYENDIETYIRNKQRQTREELRIQTEKKTLKAQNFLSAQSEPLVKKSSREEINNIDDIFYKHYPDKRRKKAT